MRRVAAGALLWLGVVAAILPASAEKSVDPKQAAQVNAQLALTYLQQGNLQAAREKADKALKQNPRTADTQMAAGFVYDRLGEDKKAKQHFEQAVKLGGKDNPDILNNAAVFQCRKGDRKQGVEYFLQAAASPLYRTPEVAYANAGYCARSDGRPADAEEYFRRALAIKPNMPAPLYELADLSLEIGNPLQARAFLQRYNAAMTASAASLLLGYRIETALGESAAAAEYARRLHTDFAGSAESVQLRDAERQAQ
jgi:type IV pilus assembly protein PilF